MGGFGSGNWHRECRDIVEEREFIDVLRIPLKVTDDSG